jgi:lysophospholipase L1-like esterase
MRFFRRNHALSLIAFAAAFVSIAGRADPQRWAAIWAASPQGPYPSGSAVAQPDLRFAFPNAATGAVDQTFRLIVKPDLWGEDMRLRFSNAFGAQPLSLDAIYLGLQASGGNLVPGTNRPVSFGGKRSVTIEPGKSLSSDPIRLDYVRKAGPSALTGRKLAVSFRVAGSSGPMTWHAKAMTTSYLSASGAGAHSSEDNDAAFLFTTTSWYFLDAVDVLAPPETAVVAAFGDSITDGTGSTLNGDDRWPDVLSRRLHERYGDRVSIVNEGIGGNRILGPTIYSSSRPEGGGPGALLRLDRDIFGLSGLTAVVWLEGINDLSRGGPPPASAEEIIVGLREGVQRLHANGIKVVGATITSSLRSANPAAGSADVDARRRTINEFIRSGGVFDGLADFDAATADPVSGALRDEFQPNSTVGGPGDRLHPNRAGYQAMGNSVDLQLLGPAAK